MKLALFVFALSIAFSANSSHAFLFDDSGRLITTEELLERVEEWEL
jgi:hypothetical protein